jgi:hypothetical protein
LWFPVENKMKPTNPNAHTYVDGTNVEPHWEQNLKISKNCLINLTWTSQLATSKSMLRARLPWFL